MPRFSRMRAKPSAITLADQARDQGQWERAAVYYREALQRRPQNPPIWIQYGHVRKEAGHWVEAERAYRTAIARDPVNVDAHLQLGHFLKVQGSAGEARALYLRAVALEPSLAPPLQEWEGLGWSRAQITELLFLAATDFVDADRHELPTTANSIPRMAGSFDSLIGRKASGWAWNPSRPGEAVDVSFHVDDKMICSCRTSIYRQDAAAPVTH